MSHWRTLQDRDYLGHFDLVDSSGSPVDVTVTIAKVEARGIKSERGTKKGAVIGFLGKEKAMIFNTTNLKTLAGMYGDQYEAWIGKRCTLYSTTTSSPEGTVGCIRVRPTVPKAAK